jgi:hypothetical protein
MESIRFFLVLRQRGLGIGVGRRRIALPRRSVPPQPVYLSVVRYVRYRTQQDWDVRVRSRH